MKKNKVSSIEKRKRYLEHIKHMVGILGIDNVGVGTDDMKFCAFADSEYGELSIYDYETIRKELNKDLRTLYNEEDVEKLLHKNIENRFLHRKVKKLSK